MEKVLRAAGKAYVLGVTSAHHCAAWQRGGRLVRTAQDLADDLPASAWRRLSSGTGTKGPRLHDWAHCKLGAVDASQYGGEARGLWTRGVLIRRNIATSDLAFFLTWSPAGTRLKTLVAIDGHRWAIEDSFETTKTELDLDHNETRSWHGWHRHVSLVMLAFAMLTAIRRRANAAAHRKAEPAAMRACSR